MLQRWLAFGTGFQIAVYPSLMAQHMQCFLNPLGWGGATSRTETLRDATMATRKIVVLHWVNVPRKRVCAST
ncbi:hypothetical protein FB567DRAFT_521400 [Paraphoma chrysanthemicola]|uniref:Uncharacterized protein n=1 Tax=Paraphoma chrysanthemicola TaxID=798071 RepID=A0A8K0R927_9PLEO|nr:hypothetical protein FB567DRAFT_521400 [Paraphoma chrysanthemicola]